MTDGGIAVKDRGAEVVFDPIADREYACHIGDGKRPLSKR